MEKSDIEKFLQVFFPYVHQREDWLKENGTNLVHYTSAEAAMNILRTKEIWLRESTCMNDFMEVQHGIDCLSAAYNTHENGKKFQAALNGIFGGITKDVEAKFNESVGLLKSETYLMCLSEHDPNENELGRLSMWRAYSANSGVAIVINTRAPLNDSGALNAFTLPVEYLSDADFADKLGRIAEAIQSEAAFIEKQGRETVANVIFNMLRFGAIATKHPGFKEEKEWRVVYSPKLTPSDHLVKDVKVINGTPQTIFKIPLKNIPERGLRGLEIPEMIERIIIGPTQFPLAMWKAFVTLLADAGVQNPESKVWTSRIPLRK